MQRVIRIPFDLLHDVAHARQNWRLGIIVNISLEELENVETITRILHKRREQHIQPVVNGDEVVPVLGSAPQR